MTSIVHRWQVGYTYPETEGGTSNNEVIWGNEVIWVSNDVKIPITGLVARLPGITRSKIPIRYGKDRVVHIWQVGYTCSET